MSHRGRRWCFLAWLAGQLVLAACGSDGADALKCAEGGVYELGCLGDGRPAAGNRPTSRCAKDAYSYFKVHVSSAPPRDDIARCRLLVQAADGEIIADYVLQAGLITSEAAWGCYPGLTAMDVGAFSYSSCEPMGDVLTFTVEASAEDGTVVERGSKPGTCTPYPPEFAIDIPMTRVN